MHTSYIGIGTNLGDKLSNLQNAIDLLADYSNILKISSIYETEAMGFQSENSFYNIVVHIETDLSPIELLNKNQTLEEKLGRVYYDDGKYHSRIIDLDILIYEDLILKTKELRIPHPHIKKRNFVLLPLIEIDSELGAPDNQNDAYKNCVSEDMKSSIEKVEKELLIPHKN